ncbi:N-acetylmuramoyl-L-alanine amidase family protein [uncultured Flavonifractor sp.]|uniref:N-acetylmuramoyl-L-alanine amidase family protein n=1 Tax=uncultured Flavonifractor sp. TaxID=1193534 RepID=UPI0025FCDBEE|nr:N-acetylmuramoyl-L-alanine amidase [uncultured Flavonifractor sp.]
MKAICNIPLESIESVEVFVNQFRYSVDQVAAQAQAKRPDCKVYVVTGGMWNADGSACPLLKADGKWISPQPWSSYGYAWDTGPDITLTLDRDARDNFWSTTCLIGHNGPIAEPSYDKTGQGGKRGRAGMGMRPGYLRLYASQDGTADARTPEALRDDMAADGCTSFVMGDGGGSAQCWFDGQTIPGDGRKCHNYIIVYAKKEPAETPPEKEDKPVSKPIVCLDPGHGPGCVNGSLDGSYKECEFTWDLYTRLRPLLEEQGIAVVSTREVESDYPGLSARASVSNRAGADLFVSLHSNAAGSSARGFVAFTSAPPETAVRNKLAAAIIGRIRAAGVVIWGSGLAHELYTVLASTTAPAVLLEYGFHTNDQDVALLKDGSYRDKLAQATCAGICDYLGLEVKEPDGESGQPNEPDSWAKEAWSKAAAAGVFDGTRPRDALTRQEAAVVLNRLGLLEKGD